MKRFAIHTALAAAAISLVLQFSGGCVILDPVEARLDKEIASEQAKIESLSAGGVANSNTNASIQNTDGDTPADSIDRTVER